MSGSGQARAAYAERIVPASAAGRDRLVAAFAAVPREAFVGPPSWQLLGRFAGAGRPTDDPADLYQDALVSLARERGINNGQPSLHAACIAALALQPGERVVHVGAGTGYYSAILAELVGPGGRVDAYEIEADLAAEAARRLQRWPQARVHAASGVDAALPPCDAVYVSAGATHPVAAWLDALGRGGRLLFPMTGADDGGAMLLVSRVGAVAFAARFLTSVSFISCSGARDEALARALAAAFRRGAARQVRSLLRDAPPQDDAWLAGEGWQLSCRDPGTRE